MESRFEDRRPSRRPDHGQITPRTYRGCVSLPPTVTPLDAFAPTMQMTRDQITRVRASWAQLLPVAPMFAALCHERLIALDPSLHMLFAQADVASVRRKLVQTLAMVVAAIEDLDQLEPAMESLGQRHAAYGVTGAHYRTMREAFLWTLERALGDAFDRETRRAWEVSFDLLATGMQNGSRSFTIATPHRDS
jgi:hemoglobin-like flavoprotein